MKSFILYDGYSCADEENLVLIFYFSSLYAFDRDWSLLTCAKSMLIVHACITWKKNDGKEGLIKY